MENKAVFRTPLKGLRALIALVCWIFSGISFFALALDPQGGVLSFVIGAGLVAAGLAALFLERVCEVDGQARSFSSAWFFMGLKVGGARTAFLDGADTIRLALVETCMFPQSGRVLQATKAFPVWIMRGEQALAYVIGWKQPEDPKSGRGGWDIGIWNLAWFPEYARYVAATCAKVLSLPLIDQMNQKTITSEAIPAEWLDLHKVRFNLLWESNCA